MLYISQELVVCRKIKTSSLGCGGATVLVSKGVLSADGPVVEGHVCCGRASRVTGLSSLVLLGFSFSRR